MLSALGIEPRDDPRALRQRCLRALVDAGLADWGVWWEPQLVDGALRPVDYGAIGFAAELGMQGYRRASAEVINHVPGPGLRRAPRAWTRAFLPGSALWGHREGIFALPLYEHVFQPVAVEDQLRLVVSEGGAMVAHVSLLRGRGDASFTDHDARHLAPLVEPVTTLMVTAARIARAALPEESGDVLFDPAGRPVLVSPTGRRWLARPGVRDGLCRWVRSLERSNERVGRWAVAGASVRWARLDGAGAHRYLVHLERPERYGSPSGVLSERQREVAELLAQGATIPEAARLLGVSADTARTHARVAYQRLAVRSRAELRRRLVEVEAA